MRWGIGQTWRRILVACSLSADLLSILPALVRTPWQLIVARGLYGVAAGGMLPTANALIADVTPPRNRGAVYGLTSAASSLGSAIGPLGSAALAAAAGIRAVFLATAAILLFVSSWAGRARRPTADAAGASRPGYRPAGVK